MHKPRHPVKPTVTGDVEEDLLRKRMARREANYQKLCTTIERTQRKLEKADRTVTRCIKLLAKLERQRRRAQKQMAEPPKVEPKPEHPKVEAREQAVANALVEPTVSDVTDIPVVVETVTFDTLGETEIGKANAESWNEIPAIRKAKRQRKPKAKPGSEAMALHHTPPQSIGPEASAVVARMQSMGFRQTSKPR
jgi:hypothetical protein